MVTTRPGEAAPATGEAAPATGGAASARPRRLVVAAAVVGPRPDGRAVLCARRSAPAALAGRWELPGGKVEPGEDPVAALHRELREELAVTVRLGRLLPGPVAGDWPIVDGMVMRVWWARLTAGVPLPLQDHDALRWVPPGGLTTLDWLDADVPIAARMARALGRGGDAT